MSNVIFRPSPPLHRIQAIELRPWPRIEPLHHLAAEPADGKLAADLPRSRKRRIAPHQVVDRLPGAPAQERQQRVEGQDFGFGAVKHQHLAS